MNIHIKQSEYTLPDNKIQELISQGKDPVFIGKKVKQLKLNAKRYLKMSLTKKNNDSYIFKKGL